jgi:ABC-type glutathione transport system ATPase component
VNAAFGDMRITRIVIAHRPETIRMSGRVVTLEGGKIRNMGPTAWQKDLQYDRRDQEPYLLESAPAREESRKRRRRKNAKQGTGGRNRHGDFRGSGEPGANRPERSDRGNTDRMPTTEPAPEREVHLPRAKFDLTLKAEPEVASKTGIATVPAE